MTYKNDLLFDEVIKAVRCLYPEQMESPAGEEIIMQNIYEFIRNMDEEVLEEDIKNIHVPTAKETAQKEIDQAIMDNIRNWGF